ncbi:bifunctional riboflavin kinase/FAD synthetase [bacterium]|nr:bifunctional riboflavin kinase/FAD synthetase [bacterium]
MEIHTEFREIKNLAAASGFFDGVHLAHQKVISKAVEFSKENDLKSAVITFKSSPAEYFNNTASKTILTLEDRLKFIEELGVDYTFIIDFKEIANIEAYDYIKNIIVKNLLPKAIVTGFNHSFGFNKSGSGLLLKNLENEFGFKYFEILPETLDEEVISSTAIKKYLSEGNITKANKMLGKRFFVKNKVIKGQQIGRTIGFKTANILYPETIADVKNGVYGANIIYGKEKFRGILNLGVKPTVTNSNKRLLEVNIFNFDKDIYGEDIVVEFEQKIRDEKKFSSIDELKIQIEKDVNYWRERSNA